MTDAGDAPTTVLIVDDDPLVRSALALMLGGQDDLAVVGEAGDGREGIELAGRLSPDVILMDIRMPRLGGLEATRELHRSPEPPRVIVLTTVDDDPLVRSALALMLGGQDDLAVVGEAGDGREGIELAGRLSPDVILMDIRMPRLGGLEATRELHRSPEPPRVIVLTTFDADDHVVGALAAGADGFLLKDTPPAEIVAAIRKVADGEPMLSPSVTRTLIERLRSDDSTSRVSGAEQRLARLTDRERDVALAVGRGLSNAEIAAGLHLSVPTVKAHVSRLFDKLGLTNRVQIAMLVHDAGLV